MARQQTPSQKAIVGRVMHEFKEGELDKRDGAPVTNPKQAIAIALHEAGASDRASSEKNRRSLRHTKARERMASTRHGKVPTRADLYGEAKRRGIAGRSTMTKAQLQRALGD